MKGLLNLNQPFLKKYIIISVIGLVLGNLLYYYFSTSGLELSTFKILEAFYASISGIILAFGMFWVSQKLDRGIPWQTQLTNRFLSGIFLHFGIAYLYCISLVHLYKIIIKGISFKLELTNDLGMKLSIILIIISLLYTIIYFALYSYYTYASFQVETIKFERRQIDLQLKALKSQLSSHFLFNNLNTISELAHQDSNATEKYIRELAKIYNYSLKSYHAHLVTFKEELELVEAYLEILKTRFGKGFKYQINLSKTTITSKIPALTLQMLVENAVKHNQMQPKAPLSIKLHSEDNFVVVSNNITIAPTKIQSFHIGLNNIKSRYRLLCNKDIVIEKSDSFTVKLPLIS